MHIPSHTVHTAAKLQYTLQPISSAHCSTLQLSATCSQPPCAHTITSSAHCSKYPVHNSSYITQCTLQQISSTYCSKSSVHTAINLQCTHSAATLFGSNTIQYIQCTFEPPQGKSTPLLAYLQNSQQTLMVDYSSPLDEEDWLIVAVH